MLVAKANGQTLRTGFHGNDIMAQQKGTMKLFFRERFLGSVRRECLDHVLIFHEKQLHRVLRSYVAYFNQARPHQGIQQRIPELPVPTAPRHNQREKVIAVPVLGGVHHDYRKVA
jgi:putative transposase